MRTTPALWRIFRDHEGHPDCCVQQALSAKELAALGLINQDVITATRTRQLAPVRLEIQARCLRGNNPVMMRRRRGHVPEYVITSAGVLGQVHKVDPRQFTAAAHRCFLVCIWGYGYGADDPMPTQVLVLQPPYLLLGASLHLDGSSVSLDPANDVSAPFFALWYAKTFGTADQQLVLHHLDTDTRIALTDDLDPLAVTEQLTAARAEADRAASLDRSR
ncbi:hypothetical protein [Nocardia brasiliensis]|uniref:hypothetical protein n=1 Tax=Nocardia brasiliensis TaxID=37326 RepID=UPI0033E15EAB